MDCASVLCFHITRIKRNEMEELVIEVLSSKLSVCFVMLTSVYYKVLGLMRLI